MASMLADPTTLVVGAASVIGALFFLQNQMGGSSPGEDASDENLDDLAASISGSKKSKKAATKKAKKTKKKSAPAPKPAPVPVVDSDDNASDSEDEVVVEPVKEVVKESEPAPAAPLSKKAKKKAKDKAAKAAAAKAPEEAKKVTKNDINNLLSKSKPAEEAAPAPAAGKKKKKKNKGAAVAAAAPVEAAPAPKASKPVEEDIVTEENDDEWVTIQSSSTRRKARKTEELKAVAAAQAAAGTWGGEEGVEGEAAPAGVPQVTASIKLGSSAGFVIGRGGSRVKEIQEETGANIDIQKDSGNEAKISGSQDQVDWAFSIIEGILAERAVEASKVEAFIPIGENPDSVKRLIGRGGGNIRYIQEMTGIKIDVQQDEGRIRLFGMPEDMSVAKDLATQALDGLNIQAGPQSLRTITLDDQGIITFIGRGGETIRRFNDDFPSCRFDVDKQKNSIRVSAPTDSDVDAAIDSINKLLQDSNFTDMIDISDCTGAVIGKGGATIKRIQQESGARLDIEKEDYGTFLKVTGMPDDVLRACKAVELVRSQPPPKKALREGEVDFEVELGGASSAVIGRKGVKINSIQKESGAKLDIPRGSTHCRIMGTPEAVEKGKVLVLAVKAEWDERNKPADKDDGDNAFATPEDTAASSEAAGSGWVQPAPEAAAGGWGAEPPAVPADAQGWGAEAEPAAAAAAEGEWSQGTGW